MLGTPYITETISNVSNGVIQQLTNAQFFTLQGDANTIIPSTSFRISYRGCIINFVKNVAHYCDAALLAFLNTEAEPITVEEFDFSLQQNSQYLSLI